MKNLIRYCGIGFGLILATWFSFSLYPGSTFCEEDTQIYLPILERMLNPSLLRQDLITQYPHTQFTLYDELIVFVARDSGLSLKTVMVNFQFLFRFLFALGFFLIGKGMKFSDGISTALAGLMLLGGNVPGPSINVVELEPIPRMMALSAVVLAMGLIALRHLYAGTLFACLGYLLHPTTTLPFWMGWLCVVLTGHLRMGNKQRLLLATLPTSAMVVLVYAASRSPSEPSHYFWSFLDPEWEALLWLRTPYDFVSGWSSFQYTLLAGTALILPLAYYRSRQIISGVLSRLIWPTTLGAGVMLLSSWLLLDHFKMAIMTQVQSARAVLFPVGWMMMLSWTSAVYISIEKGPWVEGCLWIMTALAFLVDQSLLLLLWPLLGLSVIKEFILENLLFPGKLLATRFSCFLLQVLAVIWVMAAGPFGFKGFATRNLTELAILLALATAIQTILRHFREKQIAIFPIFGPRPLRAFSIQGVNLLLPMTVMAVFLVIPGYLREAPHPNEPLRVYEVADWARTNTPVDSVFLFLDAGRGKVPGYFRFRSQRAVYVDWKGGGQVNFSRRFAVEWWHRWQTAMPQAHGQLSGNWLKNLPVDYVVTGLDNRISELHLVYQTDNYNVYGVR